MLALLREVLADFYDRLFSDTMIGYMFEGKDKNRLIEKEWEMAAGLLGAGIAYTGRPLPSVHQPLKIVGGHFDRRLQILRETLRDHAVSDDVAEAWISHTISLRDQVVSQDGAACH